MRIDRRLLCRVAAITAALYLIGFACSADRPWLLYNHTTSVPIGFYVLRSGVPTRSIGRGDLVAFALPQSAYSYARRRGDSTRVRLLKPVLAVAGDRVSTLHGELRINGAWVCNIPDTDSAGRALPRWRHARTLKAGELFVGSTRITHSFGSRFFGPIHTAQVIGVYRPLWLLPSLDNSKALLNDTTTPENIAPNGARVSGACYAATGQSLRVKRALRRLNEKSLRPVRGAIPMRIDRRPLRRVAAITAAQHRIGFACSANRSWLLYTPTPSVPIGCCLLRSGAPTSRIELDDLVAFVLRGELRSNGVLVCVIHDTDLAGRALPRWRHARRLRTGELLIGSTRIAHSFVSRFFGATHTAREVGVDRLLWRLPSLDVVNARPNNTPASPVAAPIGTCRTGTAAVTRN